MKYKPILNLCLLFVFLLMVPVGCDDWTEMEIHDSEINGFKEQNPEQYAAYTRSCGRIRPPSTHWSMLGWTMRRKYRPVRKTSCVRCRTVSIWYPCAMPAVFPGSTVKI